MISLESSPSISMRKEILRIFSFPSRLSDSGSSAMSTRFEAGVEILMVLCSMDASEVAEEPTIWFMTSRIALRLISSSTTLSGSMLPLPPIRRSVISATSYSLSSSMLLPLMPSMYCTSTTTMGSGCSAASVSQVWMERLGVVMVTCLPSSVYIVVAAVPMQMLPISPSASCSSRVK